MTETRTPIPWASADMGSSSVGGAAAVATFAAQAGKHHCIAGIAWSYSAAPTGGAITVTNGTGADSAPFTMNVTAGGPGEFTFPAPYIGSVSTALTVTAAAGGGSVTATVCALGHTLIDNMTASTGATAVPVTSYTDDDNTVLVGDTVTFTGTGSNTPDAWQWNFGDGWWGVTQSPTHVYTESGSFVPTLRAHNGAGWGTAVGSDTITVSDKTYLRTENDTPADLFYADSADGTTMYIED